MVVLILYIFFKGVKKIFKILNRFNTKNIFSRKKCQKIDLVMPGLRLKPNQVRKILSNKFESNSS